MMLSSFESQTFDPKVPKLFEGMKELHWTKILAAAHSLKGTSG